LAGVFLAYFSSCLVGQAISRLNDLAGKAPDPRGSALFLRLAGVAGAEGRERRGRYLLPKPSRIWSGSERSRRSKIKSSLFQFCSFSFRPFFSRAVGKAWPAHPVFLPRHGFSLNTKGTSHFSACSFLQKLSCLLFTKPALPLLLVQKFIDFCHTRLLFPSLCVNLLRRLMNVR